MSGRWMAVVSFCAAVTVAGCGHQPDTSDKASSAPAATHGHSSAKAAVHSGWWCEVHGVPEAECGLCDAKLAAELQKKGDWCQEHQRPDSQCFVCHPELQAKFAARYEAKFGQQPPAPQ